jgi:aryl-alcohol dehydrogenase-like predicted oxidoreductase
VPSNIGVGTLAWGDPRRGFGETYNAGDIMGAYNTLVEGGVTFFDTAEVYGYQSMKQEMSSEQLLGNFADTNYKYTPMIATKVLTASAVSRAQHYPQSRPSRPTSTGASTNTSLPPH